MRCGVWSGVCGVRCAVRAEVWAVWGGVCGVRCAVCGVGWREGTLVGVKWVAMTQSISASRYKRSGSRWSERKSVAAACHIWKATVLAGRLMEDHSNVGRSYEWYVVVGRSFSECSIVFRAIVSSAIVSSAIVSGAIVSGATVSGACCFCFVGHRPSRPPSSNDANGARSVARGATTSTARGRKQRT